MQHRAVGADLLQVETSVLAVGALVAVSVLVDVFLTVVVGVAVVVAVDLVRRWLRSAHGRRLLEQAEAAAREPVPVTAWRPDTAPPPAALPARPRPARPRSAGTYGTRPSRQRFPEDPGRLL
jgi:hypothetical protein